MRKLALALLLVFARPALADPSVTAARAALSDPDDCDNLLFSRVPDSQNLQGSIAKLMTAYVTSWAVTKGHASWSDKVSLTKFDTGQQCTCMKFSGGLDSNGNCAQFSSSTQKGETFTLKDLLQVTINQSTGESSDAVAEHVARKVYGLPAATSKLDSEHLLNLFVGLMNKRAAALGLTSSLWVTVHGGDTCDFKHGCDPQCTQSSCDTSKCAFGSQCGGHTTARDLTILWHALVRDEPKFLSLIGVRALELDKADASTTFYNSYGHSYWYYPGLDGDKNGASGACPRDTGSASCWMAQATRAGHPLIAVALQSFTTDSAGKITGFGDPDVTAMFRWGFKKVLAPERRIDSGTTLADTVTDHAIACTEGMCTSALRLTDDSFKLVLWSAQPDTPLLSKLTSFTGTVGQGAYSSLSSIDVASSDMGTLVAMISSGKLVLGAWWVTGGPSGPVGPPNVHLTYLGDDQTAGGTGTLVRVRLLGTAMGLTAVRATGGTIRLSSWQTTFSSTASPVIKHLHDGSSTLAPNLATTGELALAASVDPESAKDYLAVTATSTSAGSAALQSWRVSADGHITYLKNASLGNGRNVSVADDGVGKFGVTYTTGTATTGAVRVLTYDVAHDGTFTSTLDYTESGDVASATAIASVGPPAEKSGISLSTSKPTSTNTWAAGSGCSNSAPKTQESQKSAASFLAAAGRTGGATLAVWDSPKHWSEVGTGIDDYRIVDSGTTWGNATGFRLARLPNSDGLLNQYVSQEKRSDGTLLLIGWRVGKPTCTKNSCTGVDFDNDAKNCGACGNACGSSERCSQGTCVCAASVQTDPENCGSCGHICHGGMSCIRGRCCEACTCKGGKVLPNLCEQTSACINACDKQR